MDTLGKYKTNFLGNKNSFNIGFNNRSPFSYKSSMPTNFISVPTISASPGDYSLSGKSNYASINSGGKQLTQGLINIGKTLAKDKKEKIYLIFIVSGKKTILVKVLKILKKNILEHLKLGHQTLRIKEYQYKKKQSWNCIKPKTKTKTKTIKNKNHGKMD